MAADTSGVGLGLGEGLELSRTASALERMEAELERSASLRPSPPVVARPVARPVVVVRIPVRQVARPVARPVVRIPVRQEAFRVRHAGHVIDGDADGPMLVSGLDPDLVADLRASGLSMDEIGTHLGLQP